MSNSWGSDPNPLDTEPDPDPLNTEPDPNLDSLDTNLNFLYTDFRNQSRKFINNASNNRIPKL